jgi:arylsulfatase A-like enzyme
MTDQDQNIVLIVIDTLSAQHLPFHGYDRNTTPFLTDLAEKNTYFNYSYSTAPWTVPSHASIFSGQLPKDHGTHTQRKKFDSNSFVGDLRDEGYTTLAFSNNDLVCDELGYAKGFDEFTNVTQAQLWEYKGMETLKEVNLKNAAGDYDSPKDKYLDVLKKTVKKADLKSIYGAGKYLFASKKPGGRQKNFYYDNGAKITNRLVKERLENQEDKFFMFINFMEPHHPFAPPRKYAEKWLENPDEALLRHLKHYEEHGGDDYWWTETSEELDEEFRSLYDAEISYIDSRIEELHELITSKFENTVFYIVSDHGECVGDYGMHGHQCGIWEKTIRVPTIISGPEIEQREINRTFSLANIGDLIKGEEVNDVTGHDIFAEYYGLDGLKDPEKYSKEEQKFLKNTSKSVIKEREGLVKNTHLEDVKFTSKADGRKDDRIENEKTLREKIEKKFRDLTEGIDF